MNTYPIVDGFIWEHKDVALAMGIETPNGVIIPSNDSIGFFLHRSSPNKSEDEGIHEMFQDKSSSKISFTGRLAKSNRYKTYLEVKEKRRPSFLVVEPFKR